MSEAERLADELEKFPEYQRRENDFAAAAELRRLAAEVEALRKDAERYRWLRNMANFDRVNGRLDMTEFNTLDSAVASLMQGRCVGCGGTMAEHDKLARCVLATPTLCKSAPQAAESDPSPNPL